MAANTIPIFPSTPSLTSAQVATGLVGRTVSGVTGLTLIFTAGSNGARVDTITITAAGTTTAGVIRLWYYIGSGNSLLWQEILVTAVTPSTTLAVWSYEFNPVNWVLPATTYLYGSTHNTETFNIHVRGGNY